MKHFVFNILIITLTLFVSCGKYDDSQLWSKLEEHESRISKLEKQCRELNSNISALQTLVVALQNNLYITSVRPISEYGKEVGYSISFSNGDTAKIYHGKDGKDGSAGENGADGKDGKDGENGRDGEDGLNGSTPVIGVAQDSDGVYYWTIDGQWLLDNEGNKLRVTGENGRDGTDGKDGVDGKDGKDGADGVTGRDGLVPFLLIKDGYWWISYGGQYAKTSKRATGEDGKNGIDGKDGIDGVDGIDGKDGVGVFSSVVVSEESIEFTLVDGRCFSIAINEKSKVSISFRDTDIPNTVVVNVDFDSFDNVYAKIEAFSGVYTKSVIGWSLDSITRSEVV